MSSLFCKHIDLITISQSLWTLTAIFTNSHRSYFGNLVLFHYWSVYSRPQQWLDDFHLVAVYQNNLCQSNLCLILTLFNDLRIKIHGFTGFAGKHLQTLSSLSTATQCNCTNQTMGRTQQIWARLWEEHILWSMILRFLQGAMSSMHGLRFQSYLTTLLSR